MSKDDGLVPITSLTANFLTALALAPGNFLSTAGLINEVWADRPPTKGKAALQTLVSRLRTHAIADIIRSAGDGYGLNIDIGTVDLLQAETVNRQGRAALRSGDPVRAQRHATDALTLWLGEPGSGLSNPELLEELTTRAYSTRVQLTQLLADSQLALGNHTEAAANFKFLIGVSPLNDALCLRYLMALSGAGRPAEAIAAYADFRVRLRENLGTNPSHELTRFHDDLLHRDAKPARPRRPIRVGLPTPPNALLGRAVECAWLEKTLDTARLVTIVGEGGLGKTRLAQEAGHRLKDKFSAVYYVELAALETASELDLALTSAIGIHGSDGSTFNPHGGDTGLRDFVIQAFAKQSTLLILDNCEHLADPIAKWVSDILAGTSSTKILATSRSALKVAAERVLPLSPLPSIVEQGVAPAVALFIERARAVRPHADLPEDIVRRLCEQLDGLPLAIELAAARTRSMSVAEIEGRLTDRFALLTTRDRTGPARHRNLREVIDWSWQLLDIQQRELSQRLAFFTDGFSAEAAEYYCPHIEDQYLDSEEAPEHHLIEACPDTMDNLESLVAQSFLRVEEDPATGIVRYRMLAMVREFCFEQGRNGGDQPIILDAQLRWAQDFSRYCLTHLDGPGQAHFARRIGAEKENLVAVLALAIRTRDADTVICVFTLVGGWLVARSNYVEVTTLAAMIPEFDPSYRPTGPLAQIWLWFLCLLAIFEMFLGSPQRGAQVLSHLRRAYAQTDGLTELTEATVRYLLSLIADTSVAENDQPNQHLGSDLVLEDARNSNDPATQRLGHLFSAFLAENAGEITLALGYANHSYELAVIAKDTWTKARAAQLLASLHGLDQNPREAIIRRQEAGIALATLGIETNDLTLQTALNQLADGNFIGAKQGFESIKAMEQPSAELTLMAEVGLAELLLAQGEVEQGLRRYREALTATRWDDPQNMLWTLIAGSGCLGAHGLAGRGSDPVVIDLATRFRNFVVALHAKNPQHTDRPLLGAVAAGVAALLMPQQDLSPANSDMLFVLAERLSYRQDLPSLRRDPIRDIVFPAAIPGSSVRYLTIEQKVAKISPEDCASIILRLLASY